MSVVHDDDAGLEGQIVGTIGSEGNPFGREPQGRALVFVVERLGQRVKYFRLTNTAATSENRYFLLLRLDKLVGLS